MVLINIGGRSYKNGISLHGDNFMVKAYYDKDGELQYSTKRKKVTRSPFYNFFKKIPIVRGIISLLTSLCLLVLEAIQNPRKHWLLIIIIITNVVSLLIKPQVTSTTDLSFSKFDLFFASIVLPCAYFISRDNIKETFKFHGAEHMAVNYYNSDFEGTMSFKSRLADRCGTNFVVICIILAVIIQSIITIGTDLSMIIGFGIAYELIMWGPNFLMKLPYEIQKFTTKEPDEKHLQAAKLALEILLRKENIKHPKLKLYI